MITKKETRCLLLQTAQRLLGHQPSAQEETRWRLLQAAAEIFAEVGYHAATTREICKRAEVNLASIHYYYGDKAELYREVFRLPFLNDCNTFATLDIAQVSSKEALESFYAWLFPPTAEEDPMRQLFMRLHAREDAEPSGVLGDAMVQAFRPNHEKMQALLCREFGLAKPDTDVDRLTFRSDRPGDGLFSQSHRARLLCAKSDQRTTSQSSDGGKTGGLRPGVDRRRAQAPHCRRRYDTVTLPSFMHEPLNSF